MKKKILLFLVVSLLLIIGISNAKADSVGNITQGTYLYYNGSGVNYTGDQGTAESGVSSGRYNWFRYKYDTTNGLAYICHSGNITPPFNVSCQYKQSASDAKSSLGAAYIIRQIFGTVDGVSYNNYTANFAQYYWAELTELAYLKAIGSDYYLSKYGNISVAGGKTMNQLVSEAEAYATKYYNKPLTITLSPGSFTFALDSAGTNYVSNKIYINDANGNADNIQVTKTGDNSKFTFTDARDSGGRYVQYSIPKSSFTGSLTVGVNVSASNSYNKVRVYNCGSSVQEVSSTKLDTVPGSTSISASGTVTHQVGSLTIIKLDENGKPLAGAKIKVVGPGINETFTTTTTSKVYNNLEIGSKYTITEESAPDRYITVKDSQQVSITSSNPNQTVTIKNKLNELHISKKSITNKKILPGATLEIRDSECETVEKFCKDDKGNATACVWESTDEEKVIFGIPSGTYCLVETVAPDGYVLSTEEVKFKIEAGKNPKLVEMFNKLTSVQIYKLNEETGEPLKGAKLQIQDKDGNMLYEWVSTEEPYEILGLKKGTYYLVEIEAPKGYEKYSGKIKFEVDGEEEVIELELKNKVEYDVPDTLGGKSALLIAFAMFDIAVGIGIILYVRKNKAQE